MRSDAMLKRARWKAPLLACAALWLAASSVNATSGHIDEGAAAHAAAVRGPSVQISHPAFPGPVQLTIGRSVTGRQIMAINRRGSIAVDRTVVVVGVIHGDEPHGRLVTNQLLGADLPEGLNLWIVPTINPDGEAAGRHQNARGVDLNRNWATNWESGTAHSSGKHFSGQTPASEPETQMMMEFLTAVQPDVTLWYHSPWNRVDCNADRVGATCDEFANAIGTYSGFAPRPGTATDWIMTSELGISFIHEFASYRPSAAQVQQHVAAILSLR